MKFYITRHCSKRYLERVLNGLAITDNLLVTIFNDLNSSTNITSKVSEQYPRFVLYLKEKYGSDKGYNILKKNDTIFIATKNKDTKDTYNVLTCYIDSNMFETFNNTKLSKQDIYVRLAMAKTKFKNCDK